MVMVDRTTGSYWWQVAGEAIVGPRTGDRLTPLVSRMVHFGELTSHHPDARVLARPEGRSYPGGLFAGYPDRVSAGFTPFPVSDAVWRDDRLPAGATVVTVTVGDLVKAWPVDPPAVFDDSVGEMAVRVSTDGAGGTVTRADTDEALASRTALWFSIVSAFPAVELGSGG